MIISPPSSYIINTNSFGLKSGDRRYLFPCGPVLQYSPVSIRLFMMKTRMRYRISPSIAPRLALTLK